MKKSLFTHLTLLYSPYTSLFVDDSDWHAERSHKHILYFLCSWQLPAIS